MNSFLRRTSPFFIIVSMLCAASAAPAAEQEDVYSLIRKTVQKGRIAYENGDWKGALGEWKKVEPFLDLSSLEYAQLQQLKRHFEAAELAERRNREGGAQKRQTVQIPPEFISYLYDADDRLKKRLYEAQSRQGSQEKETVFEQALVEKALKRGQDAFEAGDYERAAAEWDKIVVKLKDETAFSDKIGRLKQSLQALRNAEGMQRQNSVPKILRPEISGELETILSQANLALQAKTQKIREERESIERGFNERQTQTLTAVEKAKIYTQAGRIPEALDEWNKVAGDFEGGSTVRSLLRDLENSHLQYKLAKQSLDEAAPKKDQKFPPPDGLKAILDNAQIKLAYETQSLQMTNANMEKELVDRQAFVNKTFSDGKAMTSEGKWLEAVYEWEKLLPYLDEGAGIAPLLENVKKRWQDQQETKKSNDLFISTRYRDSKPPFTGELEKLLNGMDNSLQKSLADAQAEHVQMERTVSDRQIWLNTTYEKGKAYYEVGKYREAIEFWSSLALQLKAEPVLQSLLAAMPQRYEAFEKAQKEAEEAAIKKNALLPLPEGMADILTAAGEKLSTLSMEAMSNAERERAAGDEKLAVMNRIFGEGRVFAERGQWEEAIKSWSELPPYLQDGEKIKVALDNLAQSHRNYSNALAGVQQSEAKVNSSFPGPAELPQILADAAFKLDKERQAVDLSRERTDRILAEKKTAVEKLYTEGKEFYDQGKLADAFAAWRSILPSLENEKELDGLLAKADQSYQMYVSSQEQSRQSLARKEIGLAAPVELPQMLETANQQLRDQIFDLKNRASQTEKMLADRKDWIGVTFQKGKLAYSQGRYQQAAVEWKTLLPFVENGSALETALLDFEKNLKVSLEASKTNAEAEVKKTAKFPAPDELGALLVQLNEKVRNEAMEASAEKIRAEQQYSERQKWLKQTFDLGKSFYLDGKYDQAIAEWEKLAPYLEAQTGALQLIDAVKQSYQDSLAAKKGALEAVTGDYQGLKLPYAIEMTRLLAEADSKLKEEASAARTKAGEMQKTLAERQEWGTTTFNKGKVLFDQDRYEEALDQWERLLPYLAENSELKKQITSLRASLDTIAAGKNTLEVSPGGEPTVKLRDEDEILGVLEAANQKFREEAAAARAKEREIQQMFDQRKQWIEFAFQKGKTYYDQGNNLKAVEEWGVLGPYLSEHPKIREMIEEMKKNYSEGKYAKQIIDSMEAKKAALLPLPEQPDQQFEETETAPSQEVTETVAQQEETVLPAGEMLISGEIVSVDEPARTITMKLFTENGEDETITVNFDEHTQVDGSEAGSLSGVQNGGSIDVRYDPQTSRAQYIYVY